MNDVQANVKTIDRALREFVIAMDDSPWSSPKARAEGMRKIAIAQRGSLGQIDSIFFVRRLAEQTIRRLLPPMLRQIGLHDAAYRCEKEGTTEAADAAFTAALAAAKSTPAAAYAVHAARHAAAAARYAARNAVVRAALRAALAARYAARNAACYAAYSAYAARFATQSASPAATRDGVLLHMIDICIDILREMKAPGITLMDQVC